MGKDINEIIKANLKLNEFAVNYGKVFTFGYDKDEENFQIFLNGELTDNYVEDPAGKFEELLCVGRIFLQGIPLTADKFALKSFSGWTHGDAALIFNNTDEKVLFKHPNGELEDLSDYGGVDKFAETDGEFVIHEYRYDLALWKLWLHDEYDYDF